MTLHIHEEATSITQSSVVEAEVYSLEAMKIAGIERESRLSSVRPKLVGKFLAPAGFSPELNREETDFYQSMCDSLDAAILAHVEELQRHAINIAEKAEAMMLCSGTDGVTYTPSYEDSQRTEYLSQAIVDLEGEKAGYASLLDAAKLLCIRYEEAREREVYGLEKY